MRYILRSILAALFELRRERVPIDVGPDHEAWLEAVDMFTRLMNHASIGGRQVMRATPVNAAAMLDAVDYECADVAAFATRRQASSPQGERRSPGSHARGLTRIPSTAEASRSQRVQ